MTEHSFEPQVVTAILRHMNDDHSDDSLAIARAFISADIDSATMTGLDTEAGIWQISINGVERAERVEWPIAVSDRGDIRRAIVALYDEACVRLGLPIREH